MADFAPPDDGKRACDTGGDTSGEVAKERYHHSPKPKGSRKRQRPVEGRADGRRRNPASKKMQTGGQGPAKPGRQGPGRQAPGRQAYAALDLGTNNCRLLIARPSGEDFTVIDAFSRVVRLGEGLALSGRLSDEAMDRALGALHDAPLSRLRRRRRCSAGRRCLKHASI